MKLIHIKDIVKYHEEEVEIRGYVIKKIVLKKVVFLQVKDITKQVQVVLDVNEFSKEIDKIKEGSSIKLVGKVAARGKGEEIQAKKFLYIGEVKDALPIDIKGKTNTSFEKGMDWRYLQLRDLKYSIIFKAQTILQESIRQFLIKQKFIEIHTPKILSTPSESGAEVFQIDYFDQKAYLAQSPQFYKQMAINSGFEKVFEIGPCFRSDRSKTSVHATEFISLDVEISWSRDHHDIMKMEQEMIKYALKRVKKECGEDIKKILGKELFTFSDDIPIISLDKAIEIAIKMGHKDYQKLSGDLDTKAQKLVSEYVLKKYDHEFVFIDKYPAVSRPFYTKKDEKDKRLSLSFDLLWKGIEITSGSQREHRYEVLKQELKDQKELSCYLDFFKYGSIPHGGFGLGLERFAMAMLDLESIKQASFIHRSITRISP